MLFRKNRDRAEAEAETEIEHFEKPTHVENQIELMSYICWATQEGYITWKRENTSFMGSTYRYIAKFPDDKIAEVFRNIIVAASGSRMEVKLASDTEINRLIMCDHDMPVRRYAQYIIRMKEQQDQKKREERARQRQEKEKGIICDAFRELGY